MVVVVDTIAVSSVQQQGADAAGVVMTVLSTID